MFDTVVTVTVKGLRLDTNSTWSFLDLKAFISSPIDFSHLVVFLISCPTVQVITVFVEVYLFYFHGIYLIHSCLKPNHPTKVNRELPELHFFFQGIFHYLAFTVQESFF